MAHAARLNLRLQKELKLLLTDPPPGASFPSLSSSSSPSLSSFHAHIQGPDGTVYANGVFKLKIQIPDRYPFQPPIVTFATPIYHPNIDNGGRICLDILNLPPKGAWQPSLNISTVLTSIGLLLSDPNPDDGLMLEVSNEFKYNRQTFDHKARSMTEKYARPGASGDGGADEGHQSLPYSTSMPTEEKELEDAKKCAVNNDTVGTKSLSVTTRKLSLEIFGSNPKGDRCQDMSEAPSLAQCKMDCELIQNSVISDEVHQDHESREWPNGSANMKSEKQSVGGKTLISKAIGASRSKRDDENKLLTVSQPSASLSHSSMLNQTAPLTQTSSRRDVESCADPVSSTGCGTTSRRHKKLGLVGSRLPLAPLSSFQNQQKNSKENLIPDVLHSNSSVTSCKRFALAEIGGKRLRDKTCELALKPVNQLKGSKDDYTEVNLQCETQEACCEKLDMEEESVGKVNGRRITEESPTSESIVVLDSEDSEDEKKVCRRSRLSLVQRRLPEKRKVKT